MNFEFATAQRIIFGSGSVREAGKAAGGLGRKAFLVRGSNAARAEALMDICRASGVEIVGACEVRTEPTITIAVEGARLARVSGAELVLGFGGGSVLDSAKAIAALATNIGDPLDYLEVVGRGQPLRQTPLPCMAIPTTAGTGSEVTRNAVLSAPEHRVKVSIRSPAMLPLVALVDPELTRGAPRTVITASGMDALTQLIEPFLSSRANPLVDALCREALPRAASALRMFASGEFDNAQAREEMSFASLCGGLALANAGLGAVHGFAGP
ncbi:MAG TPA: iron-containing alcohol dehydrogenase, partial [Methylomirabilota bacterium]|nr:iron-containing alcohol dehydrogenase [Methylomirabilota bacterium]